MEKVKVTREQAEAIEHVLSYEFEGDKDDFLDHHAYIKGLWDFERAVPLKGLNISELARALYIGYEVEPQFKEGDWVVHLDSGRLGELFINALGDFDVKMDLSVTDLSFNTMYFRHATPQEIKQEKERRFWEKYNRDVWELKKGDVLVIDGYSRIVDKVIDFHEKTVTFTDEDWDYYNNVIEEYKVVCFAENRMDVTANV